MRNSGSSVCVYRKTLLRFLPIVFNLERANQLSLLPDKDLADFCPLIEPYQVTKNHNTFRQRISRLVRESLSFSNKMKNHVGEPFDILSMTTMHSKAKD